MIFSALNFVHLLCILHMHDPPVPRYSSIANAHAHAHAYITIINFHLATQHPPPIVLFPITMHVTSNKNPLQTLSLLPEVRRSSKILRFLVNVLWSQVQDRWTYCQRSSWSESSPISNMRIFLGQTTVWERYYIVFCHFAFCCSPCA